MKLYELITPSDPITFYAPDNDIAEAVAILVGQGQAGIKAVDGSDAPNTLICFSGFEVGQAERFKKTNDERLNEVIQSAHTFAVCEPERREEYDKLTVNGKDENAVKEWDDKHRSSMNDWCGVARSFEEKEASVVTTKKPPQVVFRAE